MLIMMMILPIQDLLWLCLVAFMTHELFTDGLRGKVGLTIQLGKSTHESCSLK